MHLMIAPICVNSQSDPHVTERAVWIRDLVTTNPVLDSTPHRNLLLWENALGLIYQQCVGQKSVRTAIFTQGLAFINHS